MHREPSPLDRDEASRLLPWLVTDRLPEPELHRLLDYLKTDPSLRGELRFLSELARAVEDGGEAGSEDGSEDGSEKQPAAAERGLARVMAKIEAHERGRSRQALARPRSWSAALGVAATVAVAFAAIELAAPTPPPPVASAHARFRTLATEAPAPAALGPRLRLVFDPATSEAALRQLLLAAKATVVAGPTAAGVYTAEVPAGRDLAATVAALRADPAVLLAEPAGEP